MACLLEVLASFRQDPLLDEELAGIVEDPDDATEYPSQRPGVVPMTWLTSREASSAMLSGTYSSVADKESLPTLRPMFLPSALRYGLVDLDAGAPRMAARRELTQQIAAWLYDLHDGSSALVDGVQYESRHGDGLDLWAIFERDGDRDTSARLSKIRAILLDADHPDLLEAFRLHRLSWAR